MSLTLRRQVAALREMDVTAEDGPEADAEKEARMLFHANILSLITTHQVVDKYWIEPYGDRRQEIVFIGSTTMQQKRIVDALDGSLLTDAEFKRGPKTWAKLEDPIAVLSDDDVMEFVDVFDEEDEDESESDDEADAAPVKRGRAASKTAPHGHVHSEHCQHATASASAPAKKTTKAPVTAATGTRRSSRLA
jgi:hypothetical protein